MLVPRWIQLVLLPLALLGLWELGRAMGTLLVVVVGAGVIAVILNPLAKQFQRAVPRGLAIVLSYLVILLIFAGIGALLSAPVSDQLSHFADNFPHFVKRANRDLAEHPELPQQPRDQGPHRPAGPQRAADAAEAGPEELGLDPVVLPRRARAAGDDLRRPDPDVRALGLHAGLRPARSAAWCAAGCPPATARPADDYPLLIQHAVSGYVRGQLLFSLIMGGSAALLMELLGLLGIFRDGSHYAVFFGLFYGLMELIPYIGPILGPIPPIVVALATQPIAALWLLVVFVALQQIEGHLVAPQVFRISLRINPILVILALLSATRSTGYPGACWRCRSRR